MSNLQLDRDTLEAGQTVQISVNVTNTGDRSGDEVVQLYVSHPESLVVARPIKQLKGFARVTLAAGGKHHSYAFAESG